MSPSLPFLTNYIQIGNVIATIIATIVCCALVLTQYSGGYFILLSSFILISLALCFSSIFYFNFIKKGVINKKWLLRTFVFFALWGIVPKMFVFFIRDSDWVILYFCFAVFNVISVCMYIPVHLFSSAFIGKNRVDYFDNKIICSWVAVLHCAILVVGVSIACVFTQKLVTIIFQVYYSLFTLSAIDYLIVWKGRVEHCNVPVSRKTQSDKSKNSQPENQMLVTGAEVLNVPQVPQVPKVSKRKVTIDDETTKIDVPSGDVGPSAPVEELKDCVPENQTQADKPNDNRPVNQTPVLFECPICTNGYSDTKIPRILTQCGHTVCEKCARKLLGHQGDITCPVCRKVTSVDGTVENLAKNFAVIEMARGN